MKTTLALLLYCFMFLLPSCGWIAHQNAMDKELEDIGVEAAKKEVEVGGKSLDEDVAERKKSSMPIPHHWQQQKWSF